VLQAVSAQDLPLIQALVLLTAIVFVCVNLVVDVIHPLLDPRVLRGTSSTRRGSGQANSSGVTADDPEIQAVTA
jgi:hypothetical protein